MFGSVPTVSQSIQAINEAVDTGDSARTLAALRSPGAGLYGVTAECAPTYQDDLAKIKEEKKNEGEEMQKWFILLLVWVIAYVFSLYNYQVEID